MTLANKIIGGLAIAFLLFAGYSLYEKGKLAADRDHWKQEFRKVDSTAKATHIATAKAETVLVAGQTKWRKADAAVPEVVTESIPVLVKDTAWAIDYVKKAEANKAACRVLVVDCEKFRKTAVERFVADSNRYVKLEAKPERSCKMWFVVGTLTGGAAGAYTGYQVGKP